MTLPADTLDLWTWRETRYLLRAVTVEAYRRHMKVRSPKWGTVCLTGAIFRELARPFRFYSHEYGADSAEIAGSEAAFGEWLLGQPL